MASKDQKFEAIRATVLLLPSVLLLGLQVFGVTATDNEFRPIFHGLGQFYWFFVGLGILFSGLAPVTASAALFFLWRSKSGHSETPRVALIVLAAFLLVTSCVGCAWTFLGHPTWTQGFSG